MSLRFWKKRDENKEKLLMCPRCEKAMEKVTKQGVTIDVCNKCHGIWLDDKEIEKMVEFGQKKKTK
ncbi:MAG TPA: zf-TFIIB domain-containing protein [Candidatus Nanoarchaeia archaeon]|nr:zf-TFIIB domain-containing protein [Candidatus Nanoarchaeia archaeon]